METADSLAFGLLGPLEVHRGDTRLELRGRKPRALLALLLLSANEVVPRERLIEALWADDPPERASNTLQVYVHALRHALGADRVVTEGTGYRLRVEPGELDLDRFTRLVAERRFAEALEVWRGAPLAGLEEEPFAAGEVGRLEEARLDAVEGRIGAELALGRVDGLVGELESLVAANPYRESLRAQLMRALYASGRQADALEAYRAARRTLSEDLGLEPGRELQELESRILRQDPTLAAREVPVVSLPVPPTRLVGRQLECVSVAALLRDDATRLVTLTGPGGTGKTRLAIAAAAEVGSEFDRATFVDLSTITSPELVLPSISAALGLAEGAESSPLEAVAAELGGKSALLVLDNFEQVLDAAPAVADLIAAAPRLKVLTTSRAPLHLKAEHEYPVPPLEQQEAARLFVERAAAAGSSISASDPLVGEICASLDRLPLAIELAAARTRLFSLATLRERLDNRLELLTSGARDAPERQRTLRAAIDWSYELLGESERALFIRLEPFAGSFALVDGEAVTGASVDTLSALVDAGLVMRAPEGRLRMLETLREYAAAAPVDRDARSAVRLAHARHYLRFVERHAPALRGTGAERALAEITTEYDNLRAALANARDEEDLDTFLRLVRALDRYWYVRGYLSEGRGWIEDGLAASDGLRTRIRALVLKSASLISWRQGEHEVAKRHALAARELLEELGDEEELVGALSLLGAIEHSRDHWDEAAAIYDTTIELARRVQRPFELALVLNNAASIAFTTGDLSRSEAMYADALTISRSIEATEVIAFGLLGLMRVALEQGDTARSRSCGIESLELFDRLGFRDRVATCCVYLADIARGTREPERGARLLGAAESLRTGTGAALDHYERDVQHEATEALRAELGATRFEQAYAAGREAPRDVVAIESSRASGRR